MHYTRSFVKIFTIILLLLINSQCQLIDALSSKGLFYTQQITITKFDLGTTQGEDISNGSSQNTSVLTPPQNTSVLTPPQNTSILTPPLDDQVLTPPLNDQVLTPPLNDQVLTPPLNDQILTPPLNNQILSPSLNVQTTDNLLRVNSIMNPSVGNPPMASNNVLSITHPFNGWSFTTTYIPNYYYALSIQGLQMQAQNKWLMFNFLTQTVTQTSIYLEIKVCQTNLSCFTKVTLRMFAIDYDLVDASTNTMYTQIQNYFFIQKVFLNQTSQTINYDIKSNKSLVNFPNNWFNSAFLIQFNVKGTSSGGSKPINMYINILQILCHSSNFKISISIKESTNFNASFHVIFYNNYEVPKPKRYTLQNRNDTQLDKNSNLNQWLPSNAQLYLQSETLLCGLQSFSLTNGKINFTSNINSSRAFNAKVFNMANTQYIYILTKRLIKNICPSTAKYYFFNISKCGNTSCSQNGYYPQNKITCMLCQNPKCKTCSSSHPDSCLTCDNNTRILKDQDCLPKQGYLQNNQTIAQKCMNNCKSCVDNLTCSQCQIGYTYQSDSQTCLSLNCSSFIINCQKCSFKSLTQILCLKCMDTILYQVKDNNCSQVCGNGVIQDSEVCDDGNIENMDGCDSMCRLQDDFECQNATSNMSSNYSNALISQCIYVKEIQIQKTYLQKIPNQNRVVLRFNFYPNLAVFNKKAFYFVMSSSFVSDWTGFALSSLQAKRVQGGLYENGLFSISFSYNQMWNDNISLLFSPSDTNMKPFSYNHSRLLFTQIQSLQYIITSQSKGRLLTQTSTPSSMITLPEKSDNNLVMFSESYDIYSICQYFSYFLVSAVWLFWIFGLFYGKPIVVEFILVIQIVLLCVMSTGALTPGFSGLMLQSFVFFCFTGILSNTYQTRPIYEISSSQLKSANISIHPLQNLSFYILILSIILLIGIIAKLIEKFSKQYSLVIEKIGQYAFGQFALYALMPFLINGNLTTFYYVKSLVYEGSIQISDILALLIFHTSVIVLFIFFIKNPFWFGQFKTSFLRYDNSQYYFLIMIVLVTFLGFYFPNMFEINLHKFSGALPIIIIAFAIVVNIIKKPFLDDKHIFRTLSLYIIGLLAVTFVVAYNFLKQIQILQKYGPVIIIGLQGVLVLLTGIFLLIFIKNQGIPKFISFKSQNQNAKKYDIEVSQKESKMFQKPNINQLMVNYYEKQSKILQNIKKNTLPKIKFLDIQNDYNHLQAMLPAQNSQKYQYNMKDQEQIMDILKNLRNPKTMKNSLKCYLVNQTDQQQKKFIQNLICSQKLQKFHQSIKNSQNKSQQEETKRSINISQSKQLDKQAQIYTNQEFPEELITNYGVSWFNKKTVKKSSFEDLQKQHEKQKKKRKQKKQKKQSQNVEDESQKVQNMTYDMWVQQIEEEDRQNSKQNYNKFFLNKHKHG